MAESLAPYAKAVAALVTPLVLAVLRWALEQIGVTGVTVDSDGVLAAVTVLVTGVIVWLVPNQEPT